MQCQHGLTLFHIVRLHDKDTAVIHFFSHAEMHFCYKRVGVIFKVVAPKDLADFVWNRNPRIQVVVQCGIVQIGTAQNGNCPVIRSNGFQGHG